MTAANVQLNIFVSGLLFCKSGADICYSANLILAKYFTIDQRKGLLPVLNNKLLQYLNQDFTSVQSSFDLTLSYLFNVFVHEHYS